MRLVRVPRVADQADVLSGHDAVADAHARAALLQVCVEDVAAAADVDHDDVPLRVLEVAVPDGRVRARVDHRRDPAVARREQPFAVGVVVREQVGAAAMRLPVDDLEEVERVPLRAQRVVAVQAAGALRGNIQPLDLKMRATSTLRRCKSAGTTWRASACTSPGVWRRRRTRARSGSPERSPTWWQARGSSSRHRANTSSRAWISPGCSSGCGLGVVEECCYGRVPPHNHLTVKNNNFAIGRDRRSQTDYGLVRADWSTSTAVNRSPGCTGAG